MTLRSVRTRSTPVQGAARVARWLMLCAAGALACSDGGSAPEVETSAMPPTPFIVSNPHGGAASFQSNDAVVSTTATELVYVSLPQGAIPNADQVVIRVRSSGATMTAIAIDGGLDPVPVAAQPGDTLDLDVRLTSGSRQHFSVAAPGAARPVVVRTSPPPRKRDVPLNMTVIIVFSEPIQATSLNTSSVQLRTGSGLVTGALSFVDSTQLTASFTPNGPLAAATDYTLAVSQAIRDLDGESMASPVSVPFTTAPTSTSPSAIFTSVTAGQNHSCGLTNDGVAYCWGWNQYGTLGDGTQTNSTTPVRVAGDHRFVALSAGQGHTCGLATDGDAFCWGVGSDGRLGNGAREAQVSPTLVAGGIKFASITAGSWHTCGVSITGAAYCWGSGFYGELGTSSAWTDVECGAGQWAACPRPALVAGNLTFAILSAGPFVTCGVTTAGRTYCWGSNLGGELGIAPIDAPDRCEPIEVDIYPWVTPCSFVPTPVAGSLTFRSGRDQLAWGCGLAPDGAAYCWGRDTFYRLGAGPAYNPPQCTYPLPTGGTITGDCFGGPVAVRGAHTFKTVYTNEMFSCGILLTGAAYCWGDNAGGQLGTGPFGPEMCTSSGPCSTVPVPVAGGLRFASLAIGLGSRHTCGVTVTGEAYCWGTNDSGELGNGTTTGSPLPVRVAPLP